MRSGRVQQLLRTLSPFHVLLKVALGIVLACLWVVYVYMPNWWAPTYRREHGLYALAGTAAAAEAQVLPRKGDLPPGTPLVVVIGDSSVGGSIDVSATLAWHLRAALAERMPDHPPQIVNLSFVGCYAQDAVILAAKAMALDPDLIVYAVSPRIAPTKTSVRFATEAYAIAFQWDVVSRLGLRFTAELVGRDLLGTSLVSAALPVVRLRTALSQEVMRWLRARVPPRAAELLARLVPTTSLPAVMPWSGAESPYLWPRVYHQLEPPSLSSSALDALIRLCGRDGRCLLYEIPTNPASPRGFEPGLVQEFDDWLEAHARAAGVPVLNRRHAGDPAQFAVTFGGVPDAIHPSDAGRVAFATAVADAVLPRLQATASRPRP